MSEELREQPESAAETAQAAAQEAREFSEHARVRRGKTRGTAGSRR